ncbi:MAG: hypothetical protein JSW00_19335 [Thermoplasmata archaeon]|nr:MAG: hypothetical protein JSW00_19335 [Thermoplasmata archaeon]
MSVASVIGFAPAILLLYILLRRYEEFFAGKNIFLTFAVGMVLGMIITVLHMLIEYTFVILVILLPFFEELAKLVILNYPRLKGKHETVYFGAGLGLGIGSMAIIAIAFSVFSAHPETLGNPQTYFDLVVLSFNFSLLNGAMGVMIGYGCAKNEVANYFIRAYILHAIYNLFFLIYISSEGGLKYGPLFIATVLAIGLFWYVLRELMPKSVSPEMMKKRRREARRRQREQRKKSD